MAAADPDVPPQLVERLVAAAGRAPSMHNTQPWRFRYEPASQTIELRADPARTLRFSDPAGRAVHIACGAALFNRRSGLANLAGRAEPYGGTLTVGPGSSGGTELCWQVPLPSAVSATAGLA